MTETLKYIIESLLFVADEPIGIPQFKDVLEIEETAAIRAALEALMVEYDQRGGGFELREVAGGFQFRTRAAYSEWVKKLLKPSPTRLSRAALETLAIIAYKQPIIRADVEHIRGVDCGGVLRMLLEKKLIRVLGRKDIPGRPMIYGTTRQFLEVFNLKDLRDLPSPKEIEALGMENEDLYAPSDDETVEVGPAAEDETPADERLEDRDLSADTAAFDVSAAAPPPVKPAPDEPADTGPQPPAPSEGETMPPSPASAEEADRDPSPPPDEASGAPPAGSKKC